MMTGQFPATFFLQVPVLVVNSIHAALKLSYTYILNDLQIQLAILTINNYFTGTVKGNYLTEGSPDHFGLKTIQIGHGNPRLSNFFNRPCKVVVGNFINCVLYP